MDVLLNWPLNCWTLDPESCHYFYYNLLISELFIGQWHSAESLHSCCCLSLSLLSLPLFSSFLFVSLSICLVHFTWLPSTKPILMMCEDTLSVLMCFFLFFNLEIPTPKYGMGGSGKWSKIFNLVNVWITVASKWLINISEMYFILYYYIYVISWYCLSLQFLLSLPKKIYH